MLSKGFLTPYVKRPTSWVASCAGIRLRGVGYCSRITSSGGVLDIGSASVCGNVLVLCVYFFFF